MRKVNRRHGQQGFTLIEILVGGAILVVIAALVLPILMEQYSKRRGVAEGEYATRAALCGADKARAMGNTGSVTFSVSLNNGCFGENERIQGKGTTGATLNNTLTQQPYAVGQCTVWAANDGVYVDTVAGPDGECLGVIEGAQNSGANVISVTPSGGSLKVIKAAGGRADLGEAGLSTACRVTTPVTVRTCVRGS